MDFEKLNEIVLLLPDVDDSEILDNIITVEESKQEKDNVIKKEPPKSPVCKKRKYGSFLDEEEKKLQNKQKAKLNRKRTKEEQKKQMNELEQAKKERDQLLYEKKIWEENKKNRQRLIESLEETNKFYKELIGRASITL